MMSLAFVGHLGKLPLAACVLANSVYNISGYSLVVGMAAGMNSLSGQVSAPSSPKAGRSVEPLSLVTAPWDHRPHFGLLAYPPRLTPECWQTCACFLRVLSCLLTAGAALQAFGAGNLPAMSLILQRALILSCALSGIVWAAWTQLYLILPMLGESMPSPGTSYPPCMHRMSGIDRAMSTPFTFEHRSHVQRIVFAVCFTSLSRSIRGVSEEYVVPFCSHSLSHFETIHSFDNTLRIHIILPYAVCRTTTKNAFHQTHGQSAPWSS